MKRLKLTTPEFQIYLANIKGNPIATVTMVTPQKSKLSAASKRALEANKLFKVSSINCQLGSTYAKRVNNQLEKEGKERDFEPQLGNVSKVSGCLGSGNRGWNDKISYMIITPNRNMKSESFYIYKGEKVGMDFIRNHFIPSALKSYGNKSQGTDNQIFHLTPMVDNIIEVAVNGEIVTHIR